jgi:hypothetical protein
MEQTECSEMSAHKIQTLGHHPKEEYIITICHLHVVSTAVWSIDMVRSFQLHFRQLYFSFLNFFFLYKYVWNCYISSSKFLSTWVGVLTEIKQSFGYITVSSYVCCWQLPSLNTWTSCELVKSHVNVIVLQVCLYALHRCGTIFFKLFGAITNQNALTKKLRAGWR